MPKYHFFISAERAALMPPVAELQTIEANDPHDALAKLRRSQYRAEAGIESAWIRVAVSYYPDGAVRHTISQQVQVVQVSRDN